jgi:hypothetical protein
MGKKRGSKSHTGARSAITGQFVPIQYAKKHPKTTVIERIPNPGHGDTDKVKGGNK